MMDDVFVCDAQIHIHVGSLRLIGVALVIQWKDCESLFDIIRTDLFNREYLLCIYWVYKEYTNGFK